MTIRVAVLGAIGRMGSATCRMLDETDDLELVAAVSPAHVGVPLDELVGTDSGLEVVAGIDDFDDVDVAVDFTRPDVVSNHVIALLERGIHVVVGTSGITQDALERARQLAETGRARALVVPNFAIGAVLLMEFAARAATYLPDVEIIELHHDGKLDAPSGTALRTAERIAQARSASPDPVGGDDGHPGARGADVHGVRVHSVRLPGLVAHQEVVFGGRGQTLTLRHDTIDRTSFMPGVAVACRRVHTLDGLAIGLEHVL
ncbi:MAG: 4-hydroxy-tetrahydrodipicolinate reductase [Nitriliruptoraceae bacterium]